MIKRIHSKSSGFLFTADKTGLSAVKFIIYHLCLFCVSSSCVCLTKKVKNLMLHIHCLGFFNYAPHAFQRINGFHFIYELKTGFSKGVVKHRIGNGRNFSQNMFKAVCVPFCNGVFKEISVYFRLGVFSLQTHKKRYKGIKLCTFYYFSKIGFVKILFQMLRYNISKGCCAVRIIPDVIRQMLYIQLTVCAGFHGTVNEKSKISRGDTFKPQTFFGHDPHFV